MSGARPSPGSPRAKRYLADIQAESQLCPSATYCLKRTD
jgi:hypothetical protein